VAGASAWILTDGKAGDVAQCLGLAERLELPAELRRVAPRAPWSWLMPRGPIAPRDAPHQPHSPLAPPYPDICIASGRRAVAYLKALKRASGGKTFTVFLKDPRTGPGAADFIWVPEHDRLDGENVLRTLTGPHRLSPERLQEARDRLPPEIAGLHTPRAAVILGGNSSAYRFTRADIARLHAQLEALVHAGAALMATASRRTPPALATAIRQLVAVHGGVFWEGSGPNPYVPMLANADVIVATVDSTNMLGEAVSTGAPVLLFRPTGGSRKIDVFIAGLLHHGAVKPLGAPLETTRHHPLDATPEIAAAMAARYADFRNGPVAANR
jgi:uncharacterized protein